MRNTFTVVSRTFSCKFAGLKFVSSCNCHTISLHLNPLAISRNRVSRKLVLIINKQIRVDCPTIFFMGAGLIGTLFKIFWERMGSSSYSWFLIKNSRYKHILKDWKMEERFTATSRLTLFSAVWNMSRGNKLREIILFQDPTPDAKRELHSFALVNDTLCIYCGENDSTSHTFCKCHWSKEFYSEITKRFNAENVASLSLSPIEILFVKTSFKTNPIIRELSCTLLFAKYHPGDLVT